MIYSKEWEVAISRLCGANAAALREFIFKILQRNAFVTESRICREKNNEKLYCFNFSYCLCVGALP